MPKSIYRLNEGDWAIFNRTQENPNYFTDFYIRGDSTGTWWRPVNVSSKDPEIQAAIDKWAKGYATLKERWLSLDRPESFEHRERVYKAVYEGDRDNPAFWDHHGFIFLPWQLELWHAKQPTRVVIGGYGAAKSFGEFVPNLIHMATKRYFRCFVVAPFSNQAVEIYTQIKYLLAGTEYEKRFLHGMPMKPFPRIIVKNDLVGESVMEFYSIKDNPEKILNLAGDRFHIEQAEQVEDIEWLMEIIASRQRGQVAGRERESKLTFVANSGEKDNPQLWDLYDEAEIHPDRILALSPATFDNFYITPKQLVNIEERLGNDPQKRARALKGARPIGSGEHFPRSVIEKMHAKWLDNVMETGRNKGQHGYNFDRQPKADVVLWEIPPLKDGIHCVFADPGYGNPPDRNSAVIGVFEITDFPKKPAHLRAFAWVYGNGSPDPWLSKYVEYCYRYQAVGRNAFDSTGLQSGYERWVHGLQDLIPEPMTMAGARKFVYLNAAKTLLAKGLIEVPNIPMMFSQLAKYEIPDDKLRQDIVMMLLIAAGYLERFYYDIGNDSGVLEEEPTRFIRGERWSYHGR